MRNGFRRLLVVVLIVAAHGIVAASARAQLRTSSGPAVNYSANSVPQSAASETIHAARTQSLWMLSTRRLEPARSRSVPTVFAPDVWRYQAGQGWQTSSLHELTEASHPSTVAAIFVHGNNTSADTAAKYGGELFRALRPTTPPELPVQFIVWSWPSDSPEGTIRETAQQNDRRANVESFYLAKFLARISPDVPIHLTGYCNGARIVTGGLHGLGGGELGGLTIVAPSPPDSRPISATLLAAGLANDWVLPARPHERALQQTSRMVVTVNPADSVLRWYPYLWGRGGPDALGLAGLPPQTDRSAAARIQQVNFEPLMKRHHGWKYYAGSPQVVSLLRNELRQVAKTSNQTAAAGRRSEPSGAHSPPGQPARQTFKATHLR